MLSVACLGLAPSPVVHAPRGVARAATPICAEEGAESLFAAVAERLSNIGAANGDAAAASPSLVDAPLSPKERVVRALTFWGRVVPILGAYKAVELSADLPAPVRLAVGLTGLELPSSEEETEKAYEELHEWGSVRLEDTIQELKGFYVKTGQVISTRVDLFPEQYTSRLSSLQDSLDPMPASVVREVVERELLQGEPLDTIFSSFDDEPLGAASIAQVHAATLLDGRRVAVKVQRPNCEPKLKGDVGNLKKFSKALSNALPIDYYTVFCELERALYGELDFLQESQAALKVHASVSHTADGAPADPAVVVPLPVPGLASRRVLVMDYIPGTALNRLSATLKERGIEPGSPESELAGRRILTQLTEAFGRMMLGAGFIHGDPHPGNIFVMEGARVALIDCGQVKQISTEYAAQFWRNSGANLAQFGRNSGAILAQVCAIVLRRLLLYRYRLKLAQAILSVNEWQTTGGSPELVEKAKASMADFGVTFVDDAPDEAAAALALLLFGDSDAPMPGGFSNVELDPNSPIKSIASFPQELVLLGRATILIKGIAKRLGIKWSLAAKWKGAAEQALACGVDGCAMPVWSSPVAVPPAAPPAAAAGGASSSRTRFAEVASSLGSTGKLLGRWAGGRGGALVGAVVPTAVKTRAKKVAVGVAARAARARD